MKHPLDLDGRRLVICLGPGGVGKTTLCAALSVYAAATGIAVDVMTVDPAPRLLDALGLDPVRADLQEVALDSVALEARPRRRAKPRLRALRLDPKHTFDTLVRRHAPSDTARDAILNNRVYQNLSSALSGVGDYMAMEKLLDLVAEPTTDLVVIDTPPAAQALDFLDAPRRLLDLLNSRALSLLASSPGLMRGGLRMFDIAARAVLSAFDRVTGFHLLGDVQSFVTSFEGMYAGFAQRAEIAGKLLRAPETMVVLVTTPESERLEQTQEFARALAQSGLGVDALVVNRVMPRMPKAAEIERARIPVSLKRKLARNLKDFSALKAREERALAKLKTSLPPQVRVMAAPDLGREPHSLADLLEIARRLETS
jgi:anion-transporting  ArsA/GET3 family ATPase